jgi:hypothetical protein
MTTIRDLPDELVTAIAFKAAGHRPQLRLVCRRFCALINEAVATSETWRVEYLLDRVQSDVIRERLRPCTSYHTDQPSVLELLSRANRIVNLNSEKNRAIVERLFNPTDVFDGVCEDFNNTSPGTVNAIRFRIGTNVILHSVASLLLNTATLRYVYQEVLQVRVETLWKTQRN